MAYPFELRGDAFRRRAIVAGQHRHLNAELAQLLDSLP